MEVSDLLDIAQPRRRHTLLLALLRQARMRCRDELVEMMLRRIRARRRSRRSNSRRCTTNTGAPRKP